MASVLPYQFEPESDPESDNGADDTNDERDFSRRMDQDISQWYVFVLYTHAIYHVFRVAFQT